MKPQVTMNKRAKSVGSYTVERNVGKGSFGSIFKVKREADGKYFAMKVSPKEKKSNLSTEHEFLGQLQGSPYFPQLIGFGDANDDGYLIMELLGPSLDDILEVSPIKGLTMSTSLRVGVEMLRAIRAFHEKGFVHRDIKPSNFLIRPSRRCPIVLIDYGVSRKIIDETGKMIPPRIFTGFVGTMKYASITAHEGKELGLCDDLFSWFVSLLEIMVGKVPWRTKRVQKDMIYQKKYCDMDTFCSKLPRQLISIYHLILNMKYYDTPNYDLIIAFLAEAMEENNCSWNDKYDWETFSERRLKKVTNISIVSEGNEEPLIPTNLPLTDVEIPYTKPQLPQVENDIDDALQIPKNRYSKSVGPVSRGDPSDTSNVTPKTVADSSSSTSSLSSSITPFSSYSYSLSSTYSSSLESDSSESIKRPIPSTPPPAKLAPLVAMENSPLLLKIEPAENNVAKKKLFSVRKKKHAERKRNTLSIEQVVPADIQVPNEARNSTPIEKVVLPETVNELEKNLNDSKIAEEQPEQDDIVQEENAQEETKQASEIKQEETEEEMIDKNESKVVKQGVEDPDVGCQCRI